MNVKIQPITEIIGQPQEYGRIRPGTKNEKGWPVALKHWRLTSPDKIVLEQAAVVYGGTVRPWDDPKARVRNQHELLTESSELNVWVPNNGSFSVAYELWSGRGLQRRCDGETMFDAEADTNKPCHCSKHNLMECKPKTRASFVLPDFNFGGVWRLDSGSWDVLKEMSGMLDMLGAIAANQMFVQARLVLIEKSKMKRNPKTGRDEKVRWIIPQLIPETSAAALTSGAVPETPVALSQAHDAAPALSAGAVEVVEAEVVKPHHFRTKSEAIKAGFSNDQVIKAPNGGWTVKE